MPVGTKEDHDAEEETQARSDRREAAAMIVMWINQAFATL